MASLSASEVPAATDTQAMILLDHFSVDGVAARRAKAPALSGGVAAYASSDMFKSDVRSYAWPSGLIVS